MKVLTLALLLSFSVAKPPAQLERRPLGQLEHHSSGGRWYFAANGHAVYCYGPVMTLPQPNGDFERVATFCRDGQAVVPLKD
ncbi:MAG TPA: hypothetical protein VMI06_08110 [Terriglobia bacterium]|nr:hypothetical protein [Terriglobia bacterium]